MVIYEAAKAMCYLPQAAHRDLSPAINVLHIFLSSPKPAWMYAAVRCLYKVSMRYPEGVMKCNDKLEGMISDSNLSIATLAITTLLKTLSENGIERLMKQISAVMGEIDDEFSVVVVHGIRELGLKYPNKHNTLMAFLSNTLRDEIGESYVDCAPLLSRMICCESKAPNAVSLTEVIGCTRNARFWQHENNITNTAQRAAHFRLTSAVYLRARLNTAARHMMMATLGCAVPKNIGAAITARIVEANKEAPMW
jgi:hypothetical protein